MMYGEKNISLLKEAVERHTFIRDISKHKKEDGTFDIEGNLKTWDDGMDAFEKMMLYPQHPVSTGFGAAYMVFIPSEEKEAKDTIIVAHGGGFSIRTGCEGPNAAWYFHKLGYNTVILTYRMLPDFGRAEALEDMQTAIKLVRTHKADWNLSDRVYVMGFSAGAMICGNAATHFHEGQELSDRPDAAVICYGAMSCVSFPLPFMVQADTGLFGKDAREQYYFAPEKNVTVDTPPMFIWQTLSDDGRHGMCLARALQDAGVPYELHIFDGGVHGLGLADGENDLHWKEDHVAHWAQLADEWLQKVGKE